MPCSHAIDYIAACHEHRDCACRALFLTMPYTSLHNYTHTHPHTNVCLHIMKSIQDDCAQASLYSDFDFKRFFAKFA